MVLPVDASTSDAEEDSQVPAGPPGTLAVAVHTIFVILVLKHGAQNELDLLLHQPLPLLLSSGLATGHGSANNQQYEQYSSSGWFTAHLIDNNLAEILTKHSYSCVSQRNSQDIE